MKKLIPLILVTVLSACASAPPTVSVNDPRAVPPAFIALDAKALAEREVRAVLGEAAWNEISAASTAVLVRRGVSLPRMTQQPDGSWKAEGPYANAAVRTSQGWIGWPGGARALLAPEAGREIDRLLAQAALWTEPALPGAGCIDPGGLTSVIRLKGREHVATHPCGDVGLTGRVARIVMEGRVVDWSSVPPQYQPAGLRLGRFSDPIASHFRHSSAIHDPFNHVIRSQTEWDAMWRRITANSGPQPAAPPVDFSRDMLLLTALGTRPTGGYGITIERVIETPYTLDVQVVRTSPGPRCGTTATLTSPVDIVRVARSDKEVRWRPRDAVSHCP